MARTGTQGLLHKLCNGTDRELTIYIQNIFTTSLSLNNPVPPMDKGLGKARLKMNSRILRVDM